MARRLLFLNGLAIIGAVLNHAAGWGYVAMFYWAHRFRPVSSPNFDMIGSFSYYSLRSIEQIITSAIPAFLFVSGFFVAFATRKSQSTVDWKFIGIRIRYLAIPYLLWSLLMLSFEAVEGVFYTPIEYLRRILLGETTAAFYFVPLLIQLYLLAPYLVPLARNRWKLLLLVSGLLQVVVHIIRYYQIINIPLPFNAVMNFFAAGWFFPGNLFWFSLGIVFGFHQQIFKPFLIRFRWQMLAAAFLLLAAGIFEWELLFAASGQDWITPKETLLDNFLSITFLLCFLAFDQAPTPITRFIEELGSRSFGIYLVHSLVLTVAARAVYHLAPWMLGMQIFFQPLLILLGIGIPLLLMEIVKRSPARRIYSYQFG
jgi:probable poly-beta-1,6-N-acetyl-D-glucosamine export protein